MVEVGNDITATKDHTEYTSQERSFTDNLPEPVKKRDGRMRKREKGKKKKVRKTPDVFKMSHSRTPEEISKKELLFQPGTVQKLPVLC